MVFVLEIEKKRYFQGNGMTQTVYLWTKYTSEESEDYMYLSIKNLSNKNILKTTFFVLLKNVPPAILMSKQFF